jgi:hypothetical protein
MNYTFTCTCKWVMDWKLQPSEFKDTKSFISETRRQRRNGAVNQVTPVPNRVDEIVRSTAPV